MNATRVKEVDKGGERVQEMFAQIAPRYDFLNHTLSLGIDIRWRKYTVKRLSLATEQPVLDCCTGTGDLAILLAKHLAGRAKVFGTDFCKPMLDLAAEKAQKLPELDVEFQEADSQELPFDDSTFQAVTVAFGLRNVQDTDRGLREMVRVCAPGGQVAVLEFSEPTMPGLKQVYRGYFQHILPRIGQSVAKNDKSAYEYLPNSVAQFPCGRVLAGRMEAAGLSDVEIYPLTFGVATLYLGNLAAV